MAFCKPRRSEPHTKPNGGITRFFFLLCMTCMSLAFSAVGCPCINNTINGSENIRWWLFSNFGAQEICVEMLKRGMPLKVAPVAGAFSLGHFFAEQCKVQVDDSRRIFVVYVTGSGYASLPLAHKIGFYANMGVEYRPDFKLFDDEMYVWGRFNRFIQSPNLHITGVQDPIVNLAYQTPVGSVANLIGSAFLSSEVGRGFTVVRDESGDLFSLGLLEPPNKPLRGFTPGENRAVLASDQSKIEPQSRHYLGPFQVTGDHSALFLKAQINNVPLNYVVITKFSGDSSRQMYQSGQSLSGFTGPILAAGTLNVGTSTQKFSLFPGQYYLVIENQAPSSFVSNLLNNSDALITYSVELGDR